MEKLRYALILLFAMQFFVAMAQKATPPVAVSSATVGLKTSIHGSLIDPDSYVPLECYNVHGHNSEDVLVMTLDFRFLYNEFDCLLFPYHSKINTPHGQILLLEESEMISMDLEAIQFVPTRVKGETTFAKVIPNSAEIASINGVAADELDSHFELDVKQMARTLDISQSTHNPNLLNVKIGILPNKVLLGSLGCVLPGTGSATGSVSGSGEEPTSSEPGEGAEAISAPGVGNPNSTAEITMWYVDFKITVKVIAGKGSWDQTRYRGDWKINSIMRYFPENVTVDATAIPDPIAVGVPEYIHGISSSSNALVPPYFLFKVHSTAPGSSYECNLDPPPRPVLRQAQAVNSEPSVSDITAIPNPFDDQLLVSGSWVEGEDLELSLMSLDGKTKSLRPILRKVEPGKAQAFKYKLETVDLPSGIYILLMKSDGKLIQSKKIIKR
ncbi:MAG: T9SS type A sorting domain-containing protein [Bacteroidia bacterium]|nr:T9SS type A sorting domain-containing protein [Bacteroidia bacterium]